MNRNKSIEVEKQAGFPTGECFRLGKGCMVSGYEFKSIVSGCEFKSMVRVC